MSWESRMFLMKAMELVRWKEWVGGGGRAKGLISSTAMMALKRTAKTQKFFPNFRWL